MPVQDFSINTRDDVVGQLVNLNSAPHQTDSWELETRVDANDIVNFGEPVVRTGDRKCTNAGAVSGDIAVDGIAQRTVNREQQSRPGNGDIAYKVGETVPVVRFGAIKVLAGETVALTDDVYYAPSDGKYYASNTSPTAYKLTNCRFDKAAGADEVTYLVIKTIK